MTVTLDNRALLARLHGQFHKRGQQSPSGSILDQMKKIPSLQGMLRSQHAVEQQLEKAREEFQLEKDRHDAKYQAVAGLMKGNTALQKLEQKDAKTWKSLESQVTTRAQALKGHKNEIDKSVAKIQTVLSAFLIRAQQQVPKLYKKEAQIPDFEYHIRSYEALESAILHEGGGATHT